MISSYESGSKFDNIYIFVSHLVIISPVAIVQIDGFFIACLSENRLRYTAAGAESYAREKFTGFKASTLENSNRLPLSVLIFIVCKRIFNKVEISGFITVLALGDVGRSFFLALQLGQHNWNFFNQVKVLNLLIDVLAAGAFDLKVPIVLCRLHDGCDVVQVCLDLQLDSSHSLSICLSDC